ncbi:type III-B CRISPR module RAMP protein Cmr4 [Clostridium botulinum]|uniref:CRISPR-associated RAMP protein, Cmr4 family n=1 Tax=Clostridium botulinum (strain Langeland / NCTC 10281 / Type F) TaxID=441772 RepID=A7GFA7_CLOBL|nr:type III-B CRISPR module RAMP protein Cmr4 [Clostridium botulinum]ABS42032.1 CRISPR-associated RAMP protein, Cmr4 family [Clostridium botulinum F str. Langeland]ADF99870.1 CRISPR-associated RAMP protein, Cmr4 family [Clostridium botulinum F str. 230613]KKM42557.1 CRISPR-associated protein Cmr4 [Clostridium botulinum]MBY6792958.1 type III-B CRISPR module RAMP protein Cmr4 [Clostridium botulinum]MBY6937167.1 type III-B CRISPR module RAMP protein Cmr4 [Clostridium botulinum]
MYKDKETIYIKAISPIHAGSGQSLTSVDMPIQRESHSNIPKIEGSSLKGSVKHNVYHKLRVNKDNKKEEHKLFEKMFGSEDGNDCASAISITDAKLLLFPMRSAIDIYKLITCPYVLKRWKEETNQSFEDSILENIEDGHCVINQNSPLLSNDKVMLEEYIFEARKEDLSILFNGSFENLQINKVVILSDSDFIDMVTMYTEVITRNKINVETGTAQGTGLFSEEYLPAETVMYFSVLESAFYKGEEEVLKYFNENIGGIFQVGGNETIGKGIVKVINHDLLKGVTE